MNESVLRARREMFETLRLPVSQADVWRLRWRQRFKLLAWEAIVGWMFGVKRAMDVAVAMAGLIVLTPLFLAVSLAIIIEDGLPVFFTQDRVGLNGRVFRFYKFRSMYRNAEQMKAALTARNESTDGVIFKMKNDPRITRMGRFLSS